MKSFLVQILILFVSLAHVFAQSPKVTNGSSNSEVTKDRPPIISQPMSLNLVREDDFIGIILEVLSSELKLQNGTNTPGFLDQNSLINLESVLKGQEFRGLVRYTFLYYYNEFTPYFLSMKLSNATDEAIDETINFIIAKFISGLVYDLEIILDQKFQPELIAKLTQSLQIVFKPKSLKESLNSCYGYLNKK